MPHWREFDLLWDKHLVMVNIKNSVKRQLHTKDMSSACVGVDHCLDLIIDPS